ncbi:hypothetical protein ACVIN2_002852 [Bradyrhizobium sp. USDA 3650]
MALGYWHIRGKQGTRIVVKHSHHGDTFGAMSIGARGVFNAAYGPLLFDLTSMPFPASGREQATLDVLESACRYENRAALIVEPGVEAGGMLRYPTWVLSEMKRICEASDVLFIADEVMTGWSRTGTISPVSRPMLCQIERAIQGPHGRGAAARCDTVLARDFRCSLLERPYAHSFTRVRSRQIRWPVPPPRLTWNCGKTGQTHCCARNHARAGN